MAENRLLYGGVIIAAGHRTHGLIELLAHQMRRRLFLVYYDHANSIETQARHDFIIVLSPKDLEGVIQHYAVKQRPVPPLVHIIEPEELAKIDHAALFPGVQIAVMPQTDLSTDSKATLNLALFNDIIKRLEAQV